MIYLPHRRKAFRELFGLDPASLDGVDFFDGSPEVGMIVFKTVGTYSITPSGAGDVEALAVGGGGGARSNRGGGGGGYTIYDSSFALSAVAVTIIVGAGGVGVEGIADGNNGSQSVFSTLTANGGLSTVGLSQLGGDGGSGGGGGGGATGDGGDGGSDGSDGGAGALGAGGSGQGTTANYFGYKYGGGGGGGCHNTHDGGLGGADGGGDAGDNGALNSGSGGGSAIYDGDHHTGGSGADGIVIVRWGGYSSDYDPTTDAVT